MGVVNYLVVSGNLLAETRDGVESDYIPDPLGSTAALMSTAGAITDTFTYWPYGQARNHLGSSATPYQYCGTLGYYTDGTSGRVYVDARIYDPSLAQWLTVDPLWPLQEAYVYCGGAPVSKADPTGKNPVSDTVWWWSYCPTRVFDYTVVPSPIGVSLLSPCGPAYQTSCDKGCDEFCKGSTSPSGPGNSITGTGTMKPDGTGGCMCFCTCHSHVTGCNMPQTAYCIHQCGRFGLEYKGCTSRGSGLRDASCECGGMKNK